MRRFILLLILSFVILPAAQADAQVTRFPRTVRSVQQGAPPASGFCPAIDQSSSTSLGGWPMAGSTPQRTSYSQVSVATGTTLIDRYRPVESYINGATQMVTGDGSVYVATADGLLSLDVETLALQWRFDTEFPVTTPSIAGNYLYVPGRDLYKIDIAAARAAGVVTPDNGTIAWTFTGAGASYTGSPVPSNGRVFIANRDGSVYAIDDATGTQSWAFATGGPILSSIACDQDVIYVASMDMYGYAINATTGVQVWRSPNKLPGTGQAVYWPVVYGQYVIFTVGSAYLYQVSPGGNDVDASRGASALGTSGNNGKYFAGSTGDAGTVQTANGTQGWGSGGQVMSTTASALGTTCDRDGPGAGAAEAMTIDCWVNAYPFRRTNATLNIADGTETTHLPLLQGAQVNEVQVEQHPGVVDPTLAAYVNFGVGASTFDQSTGNRAEPFAWKQSSVWLKRIYPIGVASDEPTIVSGSGGNLFYSLCCDREFGRMYPSAGLIVQYSGNPRMEVQIGSSWPTDAEDQAIGAAAITSSSVGNPTTITTSTAHNLTNGAYVRFTSHTGSTPPLSNLQGPITVTGTNTFTIPVNVTVGGTGGYINDLCGTDTPTTSQTDCSPASTDYDPFVRPFTTNFQRLQVYYKGTQNTRSGVYGLHSFQNPLVPSAHLNGSSTRIERLVSHHSNTIVTAGPAANKTAVAPISRNAAPANTARPRTDVQMKAVLEAHIQQMVNLCAGTYVSACFLNPMYRHGTDMTSTTGAWPDQRPWMKVPADTLLALSIAYPYLSSGLKTQLEAYLAAFFTLNFNGASAVRESGWQHTPREAYEVLTASTDGINTNPVVTAMAGKPDITTGNMPQRYFYACWKYAQNVAGVNALTVFNACKPMIITSLAGLDVVQGPMIYNDYIAGWEGYLRLYQLAGSPGGDAATAATVSSNLTTIRNTRLTNFAAEHPWQGNDPWLGDQPNGISINNTIRRTNCARNFTHLVPELGSSMATSVQASIILDAIDLYERICPQWWRSMSNEGWQEAGAMLQHPFDQHAIFLAKAYVKGESQAELSKWLDVPTVRGDVYFIENVVAALQAPVAGAERLVVPSSCVAGEKCEFTFQVATTATNLQMPYDAAPPTGISGNIAGVSVDLEFSPPGDHFATTTYSQPAFWDREFTYQQIASQDWWYPTNRTGWKARISPKTSGTWDVRIRVQDSTGTYTSATRSLTVTAGTSRGFVRVSATDTRVFETEDGNTFWPIGYTDGDQWVNPLTAAQTRFAKWNTAGVNTGRLWLAPAAWWGSAWIPYRGCRGDYGTPGGGSDYIPDSDLVASGNSTFLDLSRLEGAWTAGNTHQQDACVTLNSGAMNPIAVKRSTSYKICTYARVFNVTGNGPRNGAGDYGFVIAVQNPSDPTPHTSGATAVYDYGSGNTNGQVISAYQKNTDPAQWVCGTTTTGASQDWMDDVYFSLRNISNSPTGTPRFYIMAVDIRELDGTAVVGPNIAPNAELNRTHTFFDLRALTMIDGVIAAAHASNVKLDLVLSEQNDEVLYTLTDTCAWDAGSASNFYSASTGCSRWLQRAAWRQAQARWGWSPSVFSWELLNEGDSSTRHRSAMTAFCTYMHQWPHQKHMAISSRNLALEQSFQDNAGDRECDYYVLHSYVSSTMQLSEVTRAGVTDAGSLGACANDTCFRERLAGDSAMDIQQVSEQERARVSGWTAKPVVRWEHGRDTPPSSDSVPGDSITGTPCVANGQIEHCRTNLDTRGTWLTKDVWAALNPGLVWSPGNWWNLNTDFRVGPDNSSGNGMHEIFTPFATFVSNIPLNDGHWVSAAPTVSDSNVRAFGMKDTTHARAFLLIQNRKLTWCSAVIANGSTWPNCPYTWDDSAMAGTVTVSGFAASTSYTIATTKLDENGVATTASTSQSTDGSGNMVLDLTTLVAGTVTDVGVKIGTYP